MISLEEFEERANMIDVEKIMEMTKGVKSHPEQAE